MGRVNGTFQFLEWGALPVGSLVGGVLGAALGPRAALVAAAVCGVVSAVWIATSPAPRLTSLARVAGRRRRPTVDRPGDPSARGPRSSRRPDSSRPASRSLADARMVRRSTSTVALAGPDWYEWVMWPRGAPRRTFGVRKRCRFPMQFRPGHTRRKAGSQSQGSPVPGRRETARPPGQRRQDHSEVRRERGPGAIHHGTGAARWPERSPRGYGEQVRHEIRIQGAGVPRPPGPGRTRQLGFGPRGRQALDLRGSGPRAGHRSLETVGSSGGLVASGGSAGRPVRPRRTRLDGYTRPAMDIPDLGSDLVGVAIRSAIIYVFLVIALRIGGKREVGQLSTPDLVVLLIVANGAQNAMVGDEHDPHRRRSSPASTVLVLARHRPDRHRALARPSPKALIGEPRILVRDGDGHQERHARGGDLRRRAHGRAPRARRREPRRGPPGGPRGRRLDQRPARGSGAVDRGGAEPARGRSPARRSRRVGRRARSSGGTS